MAITKHEQLIRIKDEYRASHGNAPASARDMAEWAVSERKYKLPPYATERRCAEELADAMRLEYMTVNGTRRVRTMHSYPSEQVQLWDDIRTITRENMAISIVLKRNGIVGEVKQIKRDLDFFNELHSDQPPLQTSFNFEGDLADAGLMGASSNEPGRPNGPAHGARHPLVVKL